MALANVNALGCETAVNNKRHRIQKNKTNFVKISVSGNQNSLILTE